MMQIAPLQKQQLTFLREKLTKLEQTVDRASREEFRELSKRLDAWSARVAVIGQVKAGKSTFLNAFLRQHDFLPSDINPWTSVITNIRVNVPGDPATGAVFEFFNEDDWKEIIDGTGHIRKMAEQLLPGFDPELLAQQSKELRDKAQRRLGKHYHTLLGSRHDYSFLSSDLLKRYVCAGPGSDDGLTREATGRYAALTREANIFMRLPEFLVPAIVTDTPGVNDPFLVRDEVTCRSLDKSDVFVVVLSAHQALTDVDIGLIRILAQQDSKDVLIFVNRIDEIEDYDQKYERVVDDVSKRLKKAIPEIEFTILAGSAFMADAALRLDDEGEALRAELDTPTLAAYLQTRYGQVPETREDRLLLGSGIDDVKRTLSTVIDNGVGCNQLLRLLEDTRARISAATFATKRERESVQGEIEKLGDKQDGAALKHLEDEISLILGAQSEVEALAIRANERIEAVVGTSWGALEQELNRRVDAFIQSQRSIFEDRIARDRVRNVKTDAVEIDLGPLHKKLEAAVHDCFATGRREIDGILSNSMAASCRVVTEHFGEAIEPISLDGLPFDTFATTLTMSKKSLRIDVVNERSWTFWKRRSVDKEKTFEVMRVLAVAELRPAIEKLLKAFSEAQSERATAGTERIGLMERMLETTLNERSRRLKNDQRLLKEMAENETKQAKVLGRLQSQIEVLDKRLRNLAALDSSLSGAPILEAA
jgi:GTP-binding protein EngB required for normal cell division